MKRREFLEMSALSGAALMLNNTQIIAQNKSFELEEITISELQDAMKSGKMSAKEIAKKYIKQIGKVDKNINSIIEINADALKIAEEMDKERKNGKVRSALHGIPVLLKDNIDTADRMKNNCRKSCAR